MSGSGCLVGFDIPAIQRYVFAPVRPMDIMGGSYLIEDFAQATRGIAENLGAEVIYAGGGRGLFRLPSDKRTAEFQVELRDKLRDLTEGAVECVTAAVDAAGHSADRQDAIAWALANARVFLWLDEPTKTLIGARTRPQEVCCACGLEVGDAEDTVGDGAEPEREWIGAQCRARRMRGRQAGFPNIQDLLNDEDAVLACIYMDADRLGAMFRGLPSWKALREAAERVRDAVSHCQKRAALELGADRLLMPVVGGDDLLFFCSATSAPMLLEELWNELDQRLQPLGERITFSAGMAVGPYALPLRLYFRTAQAALQEAKRFSYTSGEPHVQVESLIEGRLHGRAHGVQRGGVFGGPLPRARFWREAPCVRELMARIDAVGSAQRAGLAEDLLEESAALRDLMLDHRGVHGEESDAVELAVNEARQLGAVLHRDPHDLLWGGLGVAKLWGK